MYAKKVVSICDQVLFRIRFTSLIAVCAYSCIRMPSRRDKYRATRRENSGKTRLCLFAALGTCINGEHCKFAHHTSELRLDDAAIEDEVSRHAAKLAMAQRAAPDASQPQRATPIIACFGGPSSWTVTLTLHPDSLSLPAASENTKQRIAAMLWDAQPEQYED